MHRCMQIPELVCSHILPPSGIETSLDVGQPKHGDLAVLARTSTLFSSHALRLLWKRGGFFTKYIMLYSDPHFADLSVVFPSVGPHLSKNMLPNLLGLHWMHKDDDFQYIDCFLAPQLTAIRIPHISLAALSLLPALSLRCPKLIAITFFPRGTSDLRPLAVSAVSACVRDLHLIETLIGDMVDEAALEHLSRLPSLRHVRLCELPPTLPALPTDDRVLFPSLRTLYFRSEIESPMRFLEWANKLRLAEFTAECTAFSTSDQVHHLFTTAAGGLSHSPLTQFAFDNEFGSFNSLDSVDYLIRPQSLRTLFCFVNLTSVSVLSAVGVDLDDATVADMARSWRQIERLEFQSYYGNPTPRTTLRCLEAFPEYCLHLTKLSITFDATVIPTSQTDLSLECLKNFDVEASPISTALPVARFLSHIFPSLEHLSTLRDSLDGDEDWEAEVGPHAVQYDRQWKEVVQIFCCNATPTPVENLVDALSNEMQPRRKALVI
ncbi:hypothetical protein DFH07DRAFT_981720 [Mycena maculata]|uniref:F-box domain-containing protein n=1 Tax=Mycena maculata TaxID=230809 RepID=A0AAD7N179_9AGAR|nr:hypothetical protein DFH07DRAFT_981720 [Mycena maculata]